VGLAYRKLDALDWTALSTLHNHFVEEARSQKPDLVSSVNDLFQRAAALMQSLVDPCHVIIGAFDGDLLVGYVSVYMAPIVGTGFTDWASCDGIYVLHDYRTRATRGLWHWAKETLKCSGKSRLQGLVLTANERTVKLLTHLGFRPVGTVFEMEIANVGTIERTENGVENGGTRPEDARTVAE